MLDLDDVRRRHQPGQAANPPRTWCHRDNQDWPCETVQLLALAGQLAVTIGRVRAVIADDDRPTPAINTPGGRVARATANMIHARITNVLDDQVTVVDVARIATKIRQAWDRELTGAAGGNNAVDVRMSVIAAELLMAGDLT